MSADGPPRPPGRPRDAAPPGGETRAASSGGTSHAHAGPPQARGAPWAETRAASPGGTSTPSGGSPAHWLRVTVAWASPRAQGVVEVDLPPGATVADAVAAARAIERAGVEPGLAGFAIFGQTARPGTPVADGDRVEITRPLVADPRAARRDRAAAHPLPPGGTRQKRPTSR